MRSRLFDILPTPLRRSLRQFGSDLSLARRKRRLTVASMTERLCVSKSTYARIEKGDPTVAMGIYAMALEVLGFGSALTDSVDPKNDERGLLLDYTQVPRRIRKKKQDESGW